MVVSVCHFSSPLQVSLSLMKGVALTVAQSVQHIRRRACDACCQLFRLHGCAAGGWWVVMNAGSMWSELRERCKRVLERAASAKEKSRKRDSPALRFQRMLEATQPFFGTLPSVPPHL